MILSGETLQKIIDDLDSAMAYIPDEMKQSIKQASDLLVARQSIILGDARGELEEGQRQIILLALFKLKRERPGWDYAIGLIEDQLGGQLDWPEESGERDNLGVVKGN
jgi:hypothetical protein